MSLQDKKVEEIAFDDWSADGWVTFTADTNKRLVREFDKSLRHSLPSPTSNLRIVEVGCGTGEHAPYLLNLERSFVSSCDISLGCAKATRAKEPRAKTFIADAERMPFATASVDAVFLGSLLHHFPETNRLIGECRRILRDGGLLFAFDPNLYNPLVFVYRVILGSREMKTDNEVLYSRQQLRQSLAMAGFASPQVDSSIPVYFDKAYYDQCLGTSLGYAVYPCNLVEWLIQKIPWVRKTMGSFLVTVAAK